MKKPKVSPVEAVKTSYPQLAEESKQLQETIKALAESISGIEASLRRIGLHVSGWHEIAGGQNHDIGFSWSRDIGYTRIGDHWHIALREWSQDAGEDNEQTTYRFNDAPPWMCLEAAGKIPELLEELIERTRDMRDKLTKKHAQVEELAAVLAGLAEEVTKSQR